MSPTIVTGEQTGWTLDSSMRSSETEAQRRFTEFSEMHSPDFRVSMYSSTFVWEDDIIVLLVVCCMLIVCRVLRYCMLVNRGELVEYCTVVAMGR